jgi:hypothetical protein
MPEIMRRLNWLVSYLTERSVYLGLVLLLLLFAASRTVAPERGEEAISQPQAYPVEHNFRTVVVILDSAPVSVALDPALMPFVSSLSSSSLFGRECACVAKTTFPCLKSIFEGRAANPGTTLQDFSAVASKRTTWPGSLSAMGFRVVAASDHTLNRLYPGAFVDHLDYQTLKVPLYKRDKYAYQKTWQWLNDSTIDVVISHIIGTDKVAHEFPVGGQVYRAKYLEADDFVRQVADRLSPNDYLYVISDHGHSGTGGHTYDAVYVARGPIFPKGRREDLSAEDLLFLLSVPYGFVMPRGYEGHIRTDLILLPAELRRKLLLEQAKIWNIPVDEVSTETVEKNLNDYSSVQRDTARRSESMRNIGRLAPWWLAAALFLISELTAFQRPRQEHRIEIVAGAFALLGVALVIIGIAVGAWILALAASMRCGERLGVAKMSAALAFLLCTVAAAFWILPSHLWWLHSHNHRPIPYAIFYCLAAAAGAALSWYLRGNSWRGHGERILWTVGLIIWLLSYFGPYGYALARQGPTVVIGMLALVAVVISGGWRSLFSFSAICLAGFVVFMSFNTESFNMEYRMLDRFAQAHWGLQLACTAAVACLLAVLLRTSPSIRSVRFSVLAGAGAIAGWLLISTRFFEFPVAKLFGCLLGTIGLAGCLSLFEGSKLPIRWTALTGAIVLFATLALLLDGLELSHVDFRFAADKVIAFREEVWRALQLILWSLVKYSFALLPALYTLRLFSSDEEIPLQILQLNCWRGLMIVLGALGLALFDPRGLHGLCSEEIYFWTFLALVTWMFCLTMVRREKVVTAVSAGTVREGFEPSVPF